MPITFKTLKVSEFLSLDVSPFILGAFFSRTEITKDKKYLYTMSSYKDSKYVRVEDVRSLDDKYCQQLNLFCDDFPYWYVQNDVRSLGVVRSNIAYLLENDLALTPGRFFNRLYSKLVTRCDWLLSDDFNEEKKSFIRGFFEPRGSIDTGRPYISIDYFFNSTYEANKVRILVDYCMVPSKLLNINFRELQPQFVNDEVTRNTQVRIQLHWFMKNVGLINELKCLIYRTAYNVYSKTVINNVSYFDSPVPTIRFGNSVLDRIGYYMESIYQKNLSQAELDDFRKQLGIENDDKSNSSIRSSALIESFTLSTPNKCVCCHDKYDLKDRSFINRKTNEWYLEVHHVISIGKNKKLDDENNLVKLCPVCHDCLKRKRGLEEDQKELISIILERQPNTLEFASHFFDVDDKDEIIDKIYESLK
ncbi:MAG: HNH endonuclease [Firmicutes bacterium]|nr:HNH endonuclease [Bacillota bacterium]